MKWFGLDWHALVCTKADRVKTPAGEVCWICASPILASGSGLVFEGKPCHLHCVVSYLLAPV